MKKTLLEKVLPMTCLLLTLGAGFAWAAGGGLNLGWDDCRGLPASLNRTFACNTNTGTNTLVGSFVAPCCVTAATGVEVVMDVQSAGVSLPAWWVMRSGGCRSTSLSSSYSFTAGPFTCFDYFKGGALGSLLMDPPVGNRARIKGIAAMLSTNPNIGPITEGVEVYTFKANINNAKSTGLGACAGCATGVCVLLQSIKITQRVGSPGGDKFISAPATRSFATWQGGTGGDCYAATPARNGTWGSIKAIYR